MANFSKAVDMDLLKIFPAEEKDHDSDQASCTQK